MDKEWAKELSVRIKPSYDSEMLARKKYFKWRVTFPVLKQESTF